METSLVPQALRALVRNKFPNFLLPNAGTKISHQSDVSLVYHTLQHIDKIFKADSKVRDKYLEKLSAEFEGWIWTESEITDKFVHGTADGDEKVAWCVLDLLNIYRNMIPAAEFIYFALKPIYEGIKKSNERDAEHVAELKKANSTVPKQETDEEIEERLMYGYGGV